VLYEVNIMNLKPGTKFCPEYYRVPTGYKTSSVTYTQRTRKVKKIKGFRTRKMFRLPHAM
jgi:hypothetical protein